MSSSLRAGEWVEVLSKEEILATLNESGHLDGLPFMPEMFRYCGQKFQVFKRAHKTCDPPNGMAGRKMLRTVHLDGVRCNGEDHGGCQAQCLIFWKEAWLKRVDHKSEKVRTEISAKCTEQDVLTATRRGDGTLSDEPLYACQSTQIPQASLPLKWWDVRQYIEDIASGNARFSQMIAAGWFFLCHQVISAGIGFGTAARWAYDATQKLVGGTPYPCRVGKIPIGTKTPSLKIGLQAGDLVKIKSYDEILATVNEAGNNRGMSFDPEMVPFCGKTYRVLNRVTQIINEKTGKMQHLSNDCIMLEGVACKACYSKYRHFCPRSIYPYWREIWLERISPEDGETYAAMQDENGINEEQFAPEHRI